jgi:rsbT antagonist protein RsbS
MKIIPILKLGDVLFLTLPENMDDALAESLEDDVLIQLDKTRAKSVVIDITALELIDSFMARVISETAAAARVMDAKVVVVGMSPVVTITLLELGLDMGSITTAMDLESGLEQLGYKLVKLADTKSNSTPSKHARSSA